MRLTKWASACVTGIVLAFLVAGCQEEQTNIDVVRKHRLIAARNEQLRARIDRQDKKIENLKESLAKCRTDRDKWKETATKTVQENVRGILGHAMEKNVQLSEENVKLKARIEQLKRESNAGQ